MSIYRAPWGLDAIEIRADFRQAACPVIGTNGRQVADFQHSPRQAMRYAIEHEARAEGFDPDDADVLGEIDAALDLMTEDDD